MRNFSLLAFIYVFSCLDAYGQYKEHAFKLTSISNSSLISTGVAYERILKMNQSQQFGLLYTSYSGGGERAQGFSISHEYRFFITRAKRLNGFYIGPFFNYQNLNVFNIAGNGTINLFRGGLVFGKQWVIKEGFLIDLFVGPSIQKAIIGNNQDRQFNYSLTFNNQPSLRAGISIGILRARRNCCP